MKKPNRLDFIEQEEALNGEILGYLNEDDYIDALEDYIEYLEIKYCVNINLRDVRMQK